MFVVKLISVGLESPLQIKIFKWPHLRGIIPLQQLEESQVLYFFPLILTDRDTDPGLIRVRVQARYEKFLMLAELRSKGSGTNAALAKCINMSSLIIY